MLVAHFDGYLDCVRDLVGLGQKRAKADGRDDPAVIESESTIESHVRVKVNPED